MAGRLKGKVAVVTGAAPRGEGVGNGMATAILFAREGAKVVLVNRSAERAEKLAKQIKDEGGKASVFAADVGKADACRGDGRVRRQELRPARHPAQQRRHRRAGHARDGDLEDWHKVLEANLTTTMLCTKYCLPRMKEGGGGSIIMVSSIAGALGLMGSAGAVAYSTAKAGLHGFTHVGGGRLCDAEHPRQLHRRRLGAYADGGAHGRRGARAAQEDGADADRRHGLGHRPRRGLSRLRRIALGDRRDAADRRWAGRLGRGRVRRSAGRGARCRARWPR